MSASHRRSTEQNLVYTRQATILRKNLGEWDLILRNPRRGQLWPEMLGRLNAALNQSALMDKSIEDVMEHFVYLPKQSTANAQDIPFFLSTRLETSTTTDDPSSSQTQDQASQDGLVIQGDPTQVLSNYENKAAELAQEYEDNMVRF